MLGRNRKTETVRIPLSRDVAHPYMMESFLRSRTESGNPSNIDYYEEDVNVYIVNLLCLFLDPVYYLQVQRYVADYDADIFEKVRQSSDNRLRYWVYKANADHLLVSLGVFGLGSDNNGIGAHPRGESPERAAGRGRAYYDFAKSYCELLARPSKALAEVFSKLSCGFDKYVDILDHMRGEYLNLIDTLSEGEMFHLHRDIEQAKAEEYTRKKYDELLDLYLEWKNTGTDCLIGRIRAVAEELRKLDPSFRFEIPQPV